MADLPEQSGATNTNRASRNHVRQIVRRRLRRLYEDSIGREIAGDFQDDPQLQAAILEILENLDRKPESIEQYRWLKDHGKPKQDGAEKGEG